MKQLNLFDYEQQTTPYSFHCEGCGYKKTTGICGRPMMRWFDFVYIAEDGYYHCPGYDEHPASDPLLYEQKRP